MLRKIILWLKRIEAKSPTRRGTPKDKKHKYRLFCSHNTLRVAKIPNEKPKDKIKKRQDKKDKIKPNTQIFGFTPYVIRRKQN
ncbi:hypothetical protein A9Z63_00180 [Moraxella lacunata]|uniref:Uncharacterized protein n=1 Tax=Moraxella lacunata TaxID=477 RepID=A0A1B8Q5W1_MORLA|nr:hypothetical protein A9Z63_00180 [Moraxella lacunata]OBX65140.1 hypothetical protein A9309_03580 [Moraxella lacunata]